MAVKIGCIHVHKKSCTDGVSVTPVGQPIHAGISRPPMGPPRGPPMPMQRMGPPTSPMQAQGMRIGSMVAQQLLEMTGARGGSPVGPPGGPLRRPPLISDSHLLDVLQHVLQGMQQPLSMGDVPPLAADLSPEDALLPPSAAADFFSQLPAVFDTSESVIGALLSRCCSALASILYLTTVPLERCADAFELVLRDDPRPSVQALLQEARTSANLPPLSVPLHAPAGNTTTRLTALRGTLPPNEHAPRLQLAARLASTQAQLEQELRTPRTSPNPARHMAGVRANLERTRAMRQDVARQLGEEVTLEALAPFVQLTRLSMAALLRQAATALREQVPARLDAAAAALDDGSGDGGRSVPDLGSVVREGWCTSF